MVHLLYILIILASVPLPTDLPVADLTDSAPSRRYILWVRTPRWIDLRLYTCHYQPRPDIGRRLVQSEADPARDTVFLLKP